MHEKKGSTFALFTTLGYYLQATSMEKDTWFLSI